MKRTVFEEPEFQVIRFSAVDTAVVASGVGDGGTRTEDEDFENFENFG